MLVLGIYSLAFFLISIFLHIIKALGEYMFTFIQGHLYHQEISSFV